MGLSKLQANIKRFHAVNAERRALEREEKALKDFFSEEAGGKDAEYTWKDIVVRVEQGTSTRLDTSAVRVLLGDKVSKYETTTPSEKITVKEIVGADA